LCKSIIAIKIIASNVKQGFSYTAFKSSISVTAIFLKNEVSSIQVLSSNIYRMLFKANTHP